MNTSPTYYAMCRAADKLIAGYSVTITAARLDAQTDADVIAFANCYAESPVDNRYEAILVLCYHKSAGSL